MCNFAAQLKHVASKEARYKLSRQSACFHVFALSLTFEKTFEKD